jgi:hypothetical protein
MRDELTRRGVNMGGNDITSMTYFDGRVVWRFNANIEALEDLYKCISQTSAPYSLKTIELRLVKVGFAWIES